MSVLSSEAQKEVEDKLVAEKLISAKELAELKKKAEADNKPFMGLLFSEGKVSNEQLTRVIAKVSNVPYVNLTNVQVDQSILNLLPRDIAERYMAVPLGEMQR